MKNDNLSENSGSSKNEKEFNAWADKLEKMSDIDASRTIFDRIMSHSDIDEGSKEILSIAYEYALKLIKQNKPLEPNLLKIYLQDIKGIEISQLNMVNLVMLLSFCGINFEQK